MNWKVFWIIVLSIMGLCWLISAMVNAMADDGRVAFIQATLGATCVAIAGGLAS